VLLFVLLELRQIPPPGQRVGEGVESDLEMSSPDFAVVRTTALFASEVLHSFTLMPQKI
jgi:hypothetical protein